MLLVWNSFIKKTIYGEIQWRIAPVQQKSPALHSWERPSHRNVRVRDVKMPPRERVNEATDVR